MGNRTAEIAPDVQEFVERQPIFFVATAPLTADGHVNLSPKGLDTFRILGPSRVVYLDLTGSGNETAAHIAENARVTLMFCSFEGRPLIVRLYCRGRVITRADAEFERLVGLFPAYAGVRQVIEGSVEQVQTSCGFAVPQMSFVGERDTLPRWAESKGEAGLVEYRRTKNLTSVDGLPAPATDPQA